MPELKPCPFCGTVPVKYDGDWLIQHAEDCYMQKYVNHEWITSTRNEERWDIRSYDSGEFSPVM